MTAAIAVDAYGADGGPAVVARGALLAAERGVPSILFGPSQLEDLVSDAADVGLVKCEDFVSNTDNPAEAVQSRRDASIFQAAASVASGEASALVSAGSTGATLAAGLFVVKRIKGVSRPALAAVVPVPTGGQTVLLDAGANSEVTPEMLVQFGVMGSIFASEVLGVSVPRVGLLSVGEESSKGTDSVVSAHRLLRGLADNGTIDFIGNVEGRDIATDNVDVVVTDGFTGNVVLKTVEGTARAVGAAVGAAMRSGPISALGGLLAARSLGSIKQQLDPNSSGGALLLGVRRPVVVAHGSSSPDGIANAICLAHQAAVDGVCEKLDAALSVTFDKLPATNDA